MPMYAFCKQISGAEFEQQKAESSQKAMEELLEILLTDKNLTEKDRRKKLKQVSEQNQNQKHVWTEPKMILFSSFRFNLSFHSSLWTEC